MVKSVHSWAKYFWNTETAIFNILTPLIISEVVQFVSIHEVLFHWIEITIGDFSKSA